VLWALLAWGNCHFAPEGASVVIVDAATGALADPLLVDRGSLRPLKAPTFRAVPGPAANDDTRKRLGVGVQRPNAGPRILIVDCDGRAVDQIAELRPF
jgi:hypothetical protein